MLLHGLGGFENVLEPYTPSSPVAIVLPGRSVAPLGGVLLRLCLLRLLEELEVHHISLTGPAAASLAVVA